MTTEVKKVGNEYKLFEYRELVDDTGKLVQAAEVGGRRIRLRDVDSEIKMAEINKADAQRQIDYWTDVKTKLEAEIAKVV